MGGGGSAERPGTPGPGLRDERPQSEHQRPIPPAAQMSDQKTQPALFRGTWVGTGEMIRDRLGSVSYSETHLWEGQEVVWIPSSLLRL